MSDDPNDSLYGSLFGGLDKLVKADQEKRAAGRARAKTAGRREAPVLERIQDALNQLPGVHVDRYSVGQTQIEGRWISFGVLGHSDLGGVVVTDAGLGRAIFLEVKREKGGRLRLAQAKFLERRRLLKAYCAVVRSVDEALEAVRRCRAGEQSPPIPQPDPEGGR
jgi:hypothetical protein